jgi:hypothetical protein
MSDEMGFCRKCGAQLDSHAEARAKDTFAEFNVPEAQPKKSSLGKKLIYGIVGIIGIFFLLGVIGAMLPPSSHSTSASITPSSNSMVTTHAQDSNVCQWDWMWGTTSSIGKYYTAPAGESYVIVNLYIKNNAKRSVSTNPFYWSFTADGLKYTVDAATFSSGIKHQSVDVGQGGEIETQIVYLVKGDPSEARLRYSGFSAPEMQRINHYTSSS